MYKVNAGLQFILLSNGNKYFVWIKNICMVVNLLQ